MCDCLERESDRIYKLDRECSTGEYGSDNSSDCVFESGRNPIVQNIVKGARYCGRRGGKSFAEAIRPVRDEDTLKVACPEGYEPCIEESIQNESTQDYTICRP